MEAACIIDIEANNFSHRACLHCAEIEQQNLVVQIARLQG